jgi:hypothetical protein
MEATGPSPAARRWENRSARSPIAAVRIHLDILCRASRWGLRADAMHVPDCRCVARNDPLHSRPSHWFGLLALRCRCFFVVICRGHLLCIGPYLSAEMHWERNRAPVIGPETLAHAISQRNMASISCAVPVNDVSSAEHHCLFRWSAAWRHKLPLALRWTLTGTHASQAILTSCRHARQSADPPCRSRPESHELPRQYTAGELA